MTSNASSEEEIAYGYYVVAVIDILDQKREMEKQERIPQGNEDKSRFIESRRKTLDTVKFVRAGIRRFYEKYSAPPESRAKYHSLSAEHKEEFRRLKDVRLCIQSFSDTVIIYSPLLNSYGELTTRGVFGILCSCASMMQLGLATRIALRGGIEISSGTEIDGKEIYGLALASAHKLEEHVAQYPRIVVGQQLRDYLVQLIKESKGSVGDQINTARAEICLRMLAIDSDGVRFVDFLGKEVKGIFGDEQGELVREGLRFVTHEHKRFQAEVQKPLTRTPAEAQKLALRYALLRSYYMDRIRIWGVEP
jgi:hypothetical protein